VRADQLVIDDVHVAVVVDVALERADGDERVDGLTDRDQ